MKLMFCLVGMRIYGPPAYLLNFIIVYIGTTKTVKEFF